jgi:hypothetical protein
MLSWQVRRFVHSWRRDPVVFWMDTPQAVPYIDDLAPSLVVYDARNERVAAPDESLSFNQHESMALARADLLLTSEQTHYRDRALRGQDVYCVPTRFEQQAHTVEARQSPNITVLAQAIHTLLHERLRRPVVDPNRIISERQNGARAAAV